MNKIQLFVFLSGIGLTSHLFAAQDITGQWRSIDDKTGFSKGIIEVTKDQNGIYSGKIIEVIPRPGYTPKVLCQKCPAPYTDQPIIGLKVLANMKQSTKNQNEFEGGTILDPLSGKLYKSRIKLNNTGNRLTMRGFVGVEVIGRNQIWIRHK